VIDASAMKLQLPHLLQDRDRHGKRRVYFRLRGHKMVRIREKPGTPEFIAEYNRLLTASAAALPAKPTATHGSLKWLCLEYFRSSSFRQLDERTQHVRRLVLEAVWAEPTQPGSQLTFGAVAYPHINAKAVRVLRDRKLHAPESGNGRVKALRQVFSWAMAEEVAGVEANPAREVAYLKGKPGGFHSWSVEEVEKFEARHPVGTKARLAMALLLYTGQRRSDVTQFGRQHVREGWLRFTQRKNVRNKPITLELPVLPALQRVIDATPTGDLTFLVNDLGRAFTSAGFGNKMRQWCDEADLPHCSAHGLRKAGAAIAAQNGATSHQLMAIFGWLSLKQAELYTRGAQRKQMAGDAMKLLMRDKDET
jgi:integrase